VKILFLSPAAQLGGAERVLLDMIASVHPALPAGSEIHLIALADGPLVEAARALRVQTQVLPMPAPLSRLGDSAAEGNCFRFGWLALRTTPSLTGYVKQLRRAVRAIDPDIIHSNGIKTHVLSRFIVGATPHAKLIWHIHDLLGQRAVVGKLLRRFASRTDLAIAISHAVADDIRNALPGVRVELLLNATDIDHFSPGDGNAPELDCLAGFEHRDDVIRVGLVATYARWKGHDVFLDAAARALAANERPELRFYIVGGPIYETAGSQFSRAELVEQAKRLGIADHVGFVDFLADPVQAYRALDIVVHASTRPEPFGRTIVEAMSCGRAVIISRAGGAAELFDDGVDAIGITPGDAQQLAEKILKQAKEKAVRDSLGVAARATAATRFDRKRLGPQLFRMYLQIRKMFGPL